MLDWAFPLNIFLSQGNRGPDGEKGDPGAKGDRVWTWNFVCWHWQTDKACNDVPSLSVKFVFN